jgi:hypothetical protein
MLLRESIELLQYDFSRSTHRDAAHSRVPVLTLDDQHVLPFQATRFRCS